MSNFSETSSNYEPPSSNISREEFEKLSKATWVELWNEKFDTASEKVVKLSSKKEDLSTQISGINAELQWHLQSLQIAKNVLQNDPNNSQIASDIQKIEEVMRELTEKKQHLENLAKNYSQEIWINQKIMDEFLANTSNDIIKSVETKEASTEKTVIESLKNKNSREYSLYKQYVMDVLDIAWLQKSGKTNEEIRLIIIEHTKEMVAYIQEHTATDSQKEINLQNTTPIVPMDANTQATLDFINTGKFTEEFVEWFPDLFSNEFIDSLSSKLQESSDKSILDAIKNKESNEYSLYKQYITDELKIPGVEKTGIANLIAAKKTNAEIQAAIIASTKEIIAYIKREAKSELLYANGYTKKLSNFFEGQGSTGKNFSKYSPELQNSLRTMQTAIKKNDTDTLSPMLTNSFFERYIHETESIVRREYIEKIDVNNEAATTKFDAFRKMYPEKSWLSNNEVKQFLLDTNNTSILALLVTDADITSSKDPDIQSIIQSEDYRDLKNIVAANTLQNSNSFTKSWEGTAHEEYSISDKFLDWLKTRADQKSEEILNDIGNPIDVITNLKTDKYGRIDETSLQNAIQISRENALQSTTQNTTLQSKPQISTIEQYNAWSVISTSVDNPLHPGQKVDIKYQKNPKSWGIDMQIWGKIIQVPAENLNREYIQMLVSMALHPFLSKVINASSPETMRFFEEKFKQKYPTEKIGTYPYHYYEVIFHTIGEKSGNSIFMMQWQDKVTWLSEWLKNPTETQRLTSDLRNKWIIWNDGNFDWWAINLLPDITSNKTGTATESSETIRSVE